MSLGMDGIIAIPRGGQIQAAYDHKEIRNYVIKATSSTPFVALEVANRTLWIKGTSQPEDPNSFYEKVDKLLAFYFEIPNRNLTVNFSLDYFNTGSARYLYLLMAELKELKENGKSINVNWHYAIEDDDMLLSGKNFSSYTQLELKLVPISPRTY